MERVFRIDFYPTEWLVQTSHMTVEQRGLFIQVCALIYANKGKIKNDPAHIGRVANCSSRLAKALIEQLVASNDLQVRGEFVSQKRCELELNKKRTHLESSARGGRTSSELKAESSKNKDVSSSEPTSTPPTSSPSPSTIAIEGTVVPSPPNPQNGGALVAEDSVYVRRYVMPDGSPLSLDAFFERMWLLYPALRDKGHKGKARDQLIIKLKEGTGYEDIGRGVAKYRRYCDATGEKQPDMFRWLRDEGYARPYDIPPGTPARQSTGAAKDAERKHALTQAAKELGLIDDDPAKA